jgi:hypothetical protein
MAQRPRTCPIAERPRTRPIAQRPPACPIVPIAALNGTRAGQARLSPLHRAHRSSRAGDAPEALRAPRLARRLTKDQRCARYACGQAASGACPWIRLSDGDDPAAGTPLEPRRSAQVLERRDPNKARRAPGQWLVERDQRLRLEEREGDVLGVVRGGRAQLVGDRPRASPQDGVAQEPDRQSVERRQSLASDRRRQVAPMDRLVELRQDLRADEGRGEQLMLRRRLGALARQLDGGPGVDDELAHRGPRSSWDADTLPRDKPGMSRSRAPAKRRRLGFGSPPEIAGLADPAEDPPSPRPDRRGRRPHPPRFDPAGSRKGRPLTSVARQRDPADRWKECLER